jgi:hypothetical protein
MQIIQDVGDEEVAFFPREIDSRAVEDNKRLNLCRMVSAKELQGHQVSSLVCFAGALMVLLPCIEPDSCCL